MMNGQYCRDKDGCFYAHPLPQEGLRELLPWLEKQILRFPLWKRIPLT